MVTAMGGKVGAWHQGNRTMRPPGHRKPGQKHPEVSQQPHQLEKLESQGWRRETEEEETEEEGDPRQGSLVPSRVSPEHPMSSNRLSASQEDRGLAATGPGREKQNLASRQKQPPIRWGSGVPREELARMARAP